MKIKKILPLMLLFSVVTAALTAFLRPHAAERVFMLDAGHGGGDSGAVYCGRYEKNDNLRMTLAVGERLARSGEKVLYTRTEDAAVDLHYRSVLANSADATYFISFHRNSAASVGRGVEVYYHSSLSAQSTAAKLAAPVQDALVACGFYNRGVKQANFAVLRETKMPAILIELAFINNEAENAKLDAEFDKIADSIASALLSFVGKTLVPAATEPPMTEAPTTEPQETEPQTTEAQTTESQTTFPPKTDPADTKPQVTSPPKTEPPMTTVSPKTEPETSARITEASSEADLSTDVISEAVEESSGQTETKPSAAAPTSADSETASEAVSTSNTEGSEGDVGKPDGKRYFFIMAFLVIAAAVCAVAVIISKKREASNG